MGQSAGIAKTEIDIVDLSVLVATGLKGIAGVIGTTDMGKPGEPKLIGSWIDYTRNFGNLRADTIFPLLCRRALEGGAKLKISRACHYATITDPSTIVGTKASATLSSTTTALVSISGGKFIITGVDKTAYFTPGVAFSVVGSAGTTDYVVSAVDFTASNTRITPTITPSEPGELTYTDKSVVFKAEAVGSGYNRVSITIAPAATGATDMVDITINHLDFPNNKQTAKNVAKTPTADQITNFNDTYLWADIFNIGLVGVLPVGTVTLTGGVEDLSLVVTADYIGDPGAELGINAFDGDTDIVRIAVPEKAINAIDLALVNYAATRQDLRAVVRCPISIDGDTMVAYRECTTPYTGAAADSMYGSMTAGGLTVLDPLSNNNIDIPEIGDVLGLMSVKDSKFFEWIAAAGSKRGRIKNALGVTFNLGTPARQLSADNCDSHGINLVINHSSFGLVRWGNSSLSKANSLLKNENVAELIVFLSRTLKPLCDIELFDPNDPLTWNTIYRRVKILMDYVATNRGVYGDEGKGWLYQGDQDVDNVEDAVINQQVDISNGKYVFRLFIKPTPALKYIGITVAVTATTVSFSEFSETTQLG